ncbi:MAG: hypothetical protein WDN76_11165 [Alphaproteobacteria bacterium]
MKRWMLAFTILAAAPATAHAKSPMDPLYACAAITTDAERLKCFDETMAHLRAAEQAGDVTIVDRAGVQTLEKDSFGFHFPSLGAIFSHKPAAEAANTPSSVNQVSAKIERVSRSKDGALFVLDNGQSWRQTDTVGTALVRAGDSVTIKRAALGSFTLVRASGGEGVKVRRVE